MCEESRAQFIINLQQAASVLYALGALPATDGNFSVRLSADKIMITRSNIEKRKLTSESFADVDLVASASSECSSEWPMHRALYEARSNISCILHVHAPFLCTFAACHKKPNVNLLSEAQQALREIALVPYAQPGTTALGESLLNASKTANVYILANHGAVAVGRSVSEALHHLERAEFLARVEWQTENMGGGMPLNAAYE